MLGKLENTAMLAANRHAAMDRSCPVYGGPAALLKAISALTPEISGRAEEAEIARQMPADIFDKIVATGILKALRPREFAGAEFTSPDMIPIMEELARADASAAWSFMIAAQVPILYERFPDSVRERLFGGGCESLTRAAISPRPGVKKTDGGFIVNGRWPLASGSYQPEWVMVGGIVSERDGSLAVTDSGQPDVRLVLLPVADVKFMGNWDSMGLRSTESHDVLVENKFVPLEYSGSFNKCAADGPLIRRLPLFTTVGPIHLGVVLGIARGMLEELIELARVKRPFLNPTIVYCNDPLFQHRIGSVASRLAGARAYAIGESERCWQEGLQSTPHSPIQRVRFRSMMAHVFNECRQIAQQIFSMGGSNVLYNSSSLQRKYRDLSLALQHIVGNDEIYSSYGALLMDVVPPNVDSL